MWLNRSVPMKPMTLDLGPDSIYKCHLCSIGRKIVLSLQLVRWHILSDQPPGPVLLLWCDAVASRSHSGSAASFDSVRSYIVVVHLLLCIPVEPKESADCMHIWWAILYMFVTCTQWMFRWSFSWSTLWFIYNWLIIGRTLEPAHATVYP